MKKKYPPWYQKVGLKQVSGFLTAKEKQILKKIAKQRDKSLTRYVTRLLQKHLRDLLPPEQEDEDKS